MARPGVRRVGFAPDLRRAEQLCNFHSHRPVSDQVALGEEPLTYRVVKVPGGYEVQGWSRQALAEEAESRERFVDYLS